MVSYLKINSKAVQPGAARDPLPAILLDLPVLHGDYLPVDTEGGGARAAVELGGEWVQRLKGNDVAGICSRCTVHTTRDMDNYPFEKRTPIIEQSHVHHCCSGRHQQNIFAETDISVLPLTSAEPGRLSSRHWVGTL